MSLTDYNAPTDGRFQGQETIETVSCDQAAGSCAIEVPAPGFALVFLHSDALAASEPQSTVTFSTTTYTGRGPHPTSAPPGVSAGSTVTGSDPQQSGAGKPAPNGASANTTNGASSVLPVMSFLLTVLAGTIVIAMVY